MNNLRNGFTMIELIFVIVILGILSAVALPKFAALGEEAHIAKARSDISSIRASIANERRSRVIIGDPNYITGLSSNNVTLFDGNDSEHELLQYGITSGTADGKWSTTDTSPPYDSYQFHIDSIDVDFEYNSSNGLFNCSTTSGSDEQKDMCKSLVN